jgi:hypothetical protein
MNTTVITCNCDKCHGITAEVPQAMLDKSDVHAMVILATMPYGSAVGCKVLSRG